LCEDQGKEEEKRKKMRRREEEWVVNLFQGL